MLARLWPFVVCLLVASVSPAQEKPGPIVESGALPDSLELIEDMPADSAALAVPASFSPRSVGRRPFLRPYPGLKADSLAGLSAFDAFLLPPAGPAVFFDRTDLRLIGPAEWWEALQVVPGVFSLEPGYPGATNAFSFHGHGPDGTLVTYDGRPLAAGMAPVENINPIRQNALAGAAVMRVGASHIYGPGAGGGAILLMPIAQAPDQPYTELTRMTGIFGQRNGSITTSLRSGRVGILFHYAGAGANQWSVFDDYRSETWVGRADWVRGGFRVSAMGRGRDEKLRGLEFGSKRSDDGFEGTLAVESRLGETGLVAVRAVKHGSEIRADGEGRFTRRELHRSGAEALVRGRIGSDWRVGVLAGLNRDDVERRGYDRSVDRRKETTGFVLTRAQRAIGGWDVDLAFRYDRLYPRHDVWAPGMTVSRDLVPGTRLWFHAARETDRAAYFHRIDDFFTQVDQGVDLPRPSGQDIPSGWTGALGLRSQRGPMLVDVAVVTDRHDRVIERSPSVADRPLDVDEPVALTVDGVRSAGAWAALELGPIDLGRVVGRIGVGGSGFLASTPEHRGLQVEPSRYGEVHGRLRKDLFKGSLRMEGELGARFLGSMPTFLEDIPAQSITVARVTARIGDALIFYRSERVFDLDYLSSAYVGDVGFVPVTRQNVTVGLSWVLLD